MLRKVGIVGREAWVVGEWRRGGQLLRLAQHFLHGCTAF